MDLPCSPPDGDLHSPLHHGKAKGRPEPLGALAVGMGSGNYLVRISPVIAMCPHIPEVSLGLGVCSD